MGNVRKRPAFRHYTDMNLLRTIRISLVLLLLAAVPGFRTAARTGPETVLHAGVLPDTTVFSDLPDTTVRLTFSVDGKVTDQDSGKPVEGAEVGAPEQGYYTVTNRDGVFTLKSDRPLTRITFSFPGYETRTLYPGTTGGKNMVVRLNPVSTLLKEAIVVSGNPREILRDALAMVPVNYPVRTELSDCFYRETVQKRNRYITVSEAVTLMQKSSYNHQVWQDRVAVRQGRQLMSPRRNDTLAVKVTGGPVQAVTLDVVKNREILFDDLDLYRLEMLPAEIIDGRPHFVIRIDPDAPECTYALYRGKIYVDQVSLAFSRIELSLDTSDKDKATRMMLVSKPHRLRFTPRELSLTVSYTADPDDGLMRLRYIRTRFSFHCDWKKRLLATSFTAVNEMVVTHRHTEGPIGFSRKEAFPRNASLADRIGEFDDPDFWKDYNIIEPSESLEHAIGRIRKR